MSMYPSWFGIGDVPGDHEDLAGPDARRRVGAESPQELDGQGHVETAVAGPQDRLAVLGQLVGHAEARREGLEVEDVARTRSRLRRTLRSVVDVARLGQVVVDDALPVLGRHAVVTEPEVEGQAPGRRPLVVEEEAQRVGGPDGLERIELVLLL